MDKHVVRGVDGAVDVVKSAEAYATALSKWVAENEVASETIETAVETVFDAHPTRMPMPALVGFTLAELGASPEQYKTLGDRVTAYVRGQCAKNTGRIDIAKGVGGGVVRLSRPGEEVPARPTKKTA